MKKQKKSSSTEKERNRKTGRSKSQLKTFSFSSKQISLSSSAASSSSPEKQPSGISRASLSYDSQVLTHRCHPLNEIPRCLRARGLLLIYPLVCRFSRHSYDQKKIPTLWSLSNQSKLVYLRLKMFTTCFVLFFCPSNYSHH